MNAPATSFGEETRDAMQEITNIGMGRAGYSLARVLGTFVELSIPRVKLVSPEDIQSTFAELIDIPHDDISAIHQSFFGHWNGETIAVFNQQGCQELSELLGYSQKQDGKASEQELLLDIGNILTGACLNGIAEVLEFEVNYSAPSIFGQHVTLDKLLKPEHRKWQHCLLTEINFGLENYQFKSHLLILLSEESLPVLCQDVEDFVAQI
jgi:chemotaxis protein CheC